MLIEKAQVFNACQLSEIHGGAVFCFKLLQDFIAHLQRYIAHVNGLHLT